MASKTNFKVNGKDYYRMTKTVGKKLNENGVEVAVRKQFTGKSKKEAQAKYEEYMKKRSMGLVSDKCYFGIVVEQWIYNFFIHDSSIKDTTKDLYIGHWNNYMRGTELYTLPFDEISAATIQETYNNMDDLEDEIVVWEDEEIETILNNFDKADTRFRLRFLIVLGYSTGCRISELLALKYSDITDDGIRIYKQVINRPTFQQGKRTTYTLDLDPPKSKSSYRTIPVNADVKREMKRHIKWHKNDMDENGYETEFIFTTDSGGLYDSRNVARGCDRYYERIGVEHKGFHTYRHTFGTNLCRNGIPIQTASALLGHEDISVTAKYYVNVGSDQKQQAVDSLVGILKS